MKMLTNKSCSLLTGASLLCIMPAAASAQDAATKAEPVPAETGNDIVVTAQRRSERLGDVPISITALDASRLERAHVQSTLDLAQITPALELPQYGAFTQPAIRGISSSGSGLADSSNVAVYVDGVYQPSQQGNLADLPNIAEVQVLKGPQGTLYGQNATGGAIIINTLSPSFTTKGRAQINYGNYSDKALNGYVTRPLSQTVAVLVSGAFQDRGGFNRDLLRGGHDAGLHSYQFRGKLLWEPSSDMSFTLSAYYSNRKDTTVYATQPIRNLSQGYGASAFYGLPVSDEPHEFAHNTPPRTSIETMGVSLIGKIPVADIGTLNTVTAYGKVNAFAGNDVDATGVNIARLYDLSIDQEDFIQEVNFISENFGGLTVAAGVFYMYNRESDDPYIFQAYLGQPYPQNPPPIFQLALNASNTRNYMAAYLEGTYQFSDKLSIIVGGRYSSEDQLAQGVAYPSKDLFRDPRGTFTFSKFTPRAVVRFKPANDHTFYASYSKGFKSGFVDVNPFISCSLNNGCPGLTTPVRPEELTSYEVGYKGRFGRAFSISVAGFHYDYKDIQTYIYEPTTGGQYLNAAAARVNGIEADATLNPIAGLSLGVGAAYVDSKYKKFPNAQTFVPYGTVIDGVPLTCPDSGPGGNCNVSRDVAGKPLLKAPKFTLTGNISYEHETDWGEIGGSANVKYSSGFSFDPAGVVRQGRYALVNAELYVKPTAALKIGVYGRNLTNNDYLASVLQSTIASAASYGTPRQYGVQIGYDF